MPDLAAVPRETIDGWVAALSAVPPAARVYDVPSRRAELEFGITPSLADLLTASGLPRSSEGRFAWSDLHYIALRLGSARLYLKTMRAWAHSVATTAQHGPQTVRLRYRTYASAGAEVTVLLPGERRQTVRVGADEIAATVDVQVSSVGAAFPPSVERLMREAAAFDFYLLPPALAGDVGFARRSGLAGCMTASRFLVGACRDEGIEARMAYGLLLAPPLGTVHEWAEIRVGDRWAPADPMLLGILARFAGLDASRWPCTYSPSAVLLRLADRTTPLVDGPDGPVRTSAVVDLEPPGAPAGA